MIKLMSYVTWYKVQHGHESARRVSLVQFGGRKWLKVVSLDASSSGGLRVHKVPLSDEKYMTPLLLKGKPYPMSRALKTFRKLAKSHGCTKGAMRLIKEASV